MKKRILVVATALLTLALLFSGCKTYKDTNGEDNYELQTLTEQDILQGGSVVKTGSSSSSVNNTYTVKVKTMNGVDTLETFSGEKVVLMLSVTINKGNARLVVCTKDEILHEFELNKGGQLFSFEVDTDSKAYLRIAGEDCGYSLSYQLQRSKK